MEARHHGHAITAQVRDPWTGKMGQGLSSNQQESMSQTLTERELRLINKGPDGIRPNGREVLGFADLDPGKAALAIIKDHTDGRIFVRKREVNRGTQDITAKDLDDAKHIFIKILSEDFRNLCRVMSDTKTLI